MTADGFQLLQAHRFPARSIRIAALDGVDGDRGLTNAEIVVLPTNSGLPLVPQRRIHGGPNRGKLGGIVPPWSRLDLGSRDEQRWFAVCVCGG